MGQRAGVGVGSMWGGVGWGLAGRNVHSAGSYTVLNSL